MSLTKSQSSGALMKSGSAIAGTGPDGGVEIPKLPKYLSVNGLTSRRKLSASTGNIHGYQAEDYKQLNWPLPRMFGYEKYGYSLIDISDPRFLKECAGSSKKLIRLQYDYQIVDLEWRKTYKKLNDAEHSYANSGEKCPQFAKTNMKKEVDNLTKYLIELQEQKDMYETEITAVYDRCANIKGMIKKETDLEDLRQTLEAHTRDRIPQDAAFWKTKFNTRSPTGDRS